MAIFLKISANFNSHSIEVTQTPIILGRSSSCSLQLKDNVVSGKHIKFFIKDGKLYAEDLDTTNGSFINGEAFGKTIFTLKDTIKVGETTIVLDKSKMTVKEIFSYKSSEETGNINLKQLKKKATTEDAEPDMPQKNPATPAEAANSLSGLIKNAKVHQSQKKKKAPEASPSTLSDDEDEDEDEAEKNGQNLAGKLKNLFKKP